MQARDATLRTDEFKDRILCLRGELTFKSARRHLFVLGGYLFLSVLMTYPLVLRLTTAIPGDGFDGWTNYWNLWWVKTAVLDLHQSPFFTTHLYHPAGYSLYFHTLNIFNSLLTLPIQLGLGLAVSYNFVVAFSFVIGGYGTYLLALEAIDVGDSVNEHLIAFLAGVVFTFSPFHFAHLLGHMPVISVEWIPFYALALVRSLRARRMRVVPHLGLPVVFLVLTALCDWYFVLYLLIFTGLYVGYRIWLRRQAVQPLLRAAWILLLSGVILSPLLVPMAVEAVGDSAHLLSPFDTTVRLSADLLAFVTPNEFHPLWGEGAARLSEAFTSSTSERMVFAGYIPLALAGYALCSTRRAGAFCATSCLVFLVLSLGPYLHIGGREMPIPLPYLALYRVVPFFKIARSVSRFDVMAMLNLALLAALGVQRLSAALRRSWARSFVVVSIALVCFEFLPVPYPLSEVKVPPFYERLARPDEQYAILELPMNWDRPTHLLYQTVHHKPIISGYVARPNPLPLVERVPVLQHFRFLGPDIIAQDPGEVAPEVFEYLGIKYVILHGYMLPPGRERQANLALVEEVFADRSPSYQDRRISVYRVYGGEKDSPFLILGPEWGGREEWQGEPARELGLEATCSIVAPSAGEARLEFGALTASSTRTLEVRFNGELVGEYQVPSGPERFVTPPLSLREGGNVLQLRDLSGGDPAIVFTSLDLREE